ncbi:DUF6480 family protein [Kitasatospora sp. NPDC096147]|uniref:DUF6480 family protein n=1 Tax=Kitasatospora sp. NPDC096147 TaxID=3364093 RepID=UPI0037F92ED6
MSQHDDPTGPREAGPADDDPVRPVHWSAEQILIGGRGAAAGWRVDWQAESAGDGGAGVMWLSRAGRRVSVLFSHDGAFRYAREGAAGTDEVELDREELLRVINEPGRTGVLPEETPAGESSTTAGISVPEPPEVRTAWGAWPLVLVGVMVLCVLGFLIGRIFSW